MKRGKDEEKIMEPMFPRLHVNDTEKGGPRAPPRNKMALYEQLSIPSQRFNHGGLPLNPNNTTNLVSSAPASSTQANGHERGMFFPLQLPPSIHPAEKPLACYTDSNAPLVQLEQKTNLEEDDLQVPIFVHSEMDQDHGDNLSETSMVDSISAVDILPDDVVGIIGQKHFWKARRAIVNQQRVFAVQVFELHRLMKVQRLIAASPHLLLDHNAYLKKPLKGISEKKLRLHCKEVVSEKSNAVVAEKQKLDIPKQNVVAEKSNHTMECSEHTDSIPSVQKEVVKASISSVQNSNDSQNYRPIFLNSPLTGVGSWGFNQKPGQWLIPVMSPSEGLVYKPYIEPVHARDESFLHYGVPPPPPPHHYHQVIGVSPFAPLGDQGHFPLYGSFHSVSAGRKVQLPLYGSSNLVSAEPKVQLPLCFSSNLVSAEPKVQLPPYVSYNSVSVGPSFKVQRPNLSLCNVTSPVSNESSELQISTKSSSSTSIRAGESTRVIKVVPRNASSATESVARIFQSIQEERKQ